MASFKGQHKGFTLIEILVVVLIIGLVIGIALVAPNNSGPGQKLKDEATRLQVLIEQARERALMEDQEFGLVIDDESYHWLRWSRDEETWQRLQGESFRRHSFGDDVQLLNLTDESAAKASKTNTSGSGGERLRSSRRNSSNSQSQGDDIKTPTWIFYTDTQVTPFRLEFMLRNDSRRSIILETDGIGPVKIP